MKIHADHQKVKDGTELKYEDYCSLLLSIAQVYDKHFFKKCTPKSKWHVYEHELDSIHEDGEFYDAFSYDIDSDINVIEANAHN